PGEGRTARARPGGAAALTEEGLADRGEVRRLPDHRPVPAAADDVQAAVRQQVDERRGRGPPRYDAVGPAMHHQARVPAAAAPRPGGSAIAPPIVPMSTIRRTAAGRATAMDSAIAPPIELPITSTVSTPSVSSSASACLVHAARPYVRGSPVAVPPKPSW